MLQEFVNGFVQPLHILLLIATRIEADAGGDFRARFVQLRNHEVVGKGSFGCRYPDVVGSRELRIGNFS